jgi:hypothetical protein
VELCGIFIIDYAEVFVESWEPTLLFFGCLQDPRHSDSHPHVLVYDIARVLVMAREQQRMLADAIQNRGHILQFFVRVIVRKKYLGKTTCLVVGEGLFGCKETRKKNTS